MIFCKIVGTDQDCYHILSKSHEMVLSYVLSRSPFNYEFYCILLQLICSKPNLCLYPGLLIMIRMPYHINWGHSFLFLWHLIGPFTRVKHSILGNQGAGLSCIDFVIPSRGVISRWSPQFEKWLEPLRRLNSLTGISICLSSINLAVHVIQSESLQSSILTKYRKYFVHCRKSVQIFYLVFPAQ